MTLPVHEERLRDPPCNDSSESCPTSPALPFSQRAAPNNVPLLFFGLGPQTACAINPLPEINPESDRKVALMDDAQRDDIWFCHQPTLPTFLIRVVSSTVALDPAYGQLVFLVQAQVQIASGGPSSHSRPITVHRHFFIPEYRIDSQTKGVPARSSLDVASAFRFPPRWCFE